MSKVHFSHQQSTHTTISLQCCGVKDFSLTLAQFQASPTNELQDQLTKASSDLSPITNQTRKLVKGRFADFWKKFINKCPNRVLYDVDFQSTLSTWFDFVTNAKYRDVRYICTVAGLHLISGLVSNISRIRKELEKANQQLEIDQKKSSSQSTKSSPKSPKPSSIQQKVDTLQSHLEELFKWFELLFKR